ncbi:response regulator transcription factor [Virgibacillus siamensis]|uniref:response regulator transcription factor n=1 Tax=Virgibacillus siamensis TaxID=480071 RepID=UPI0009879513|nr:response regulator transcription factor [Virgibacillus siamensis]
MSNHIVIIEDDESIARIIQLELEYEGFAVDVAHSGRKGLELVQSNRTDLVILDVMIPELNGMEVLRRIRAVDEQIIVIMLTARDTVYDKVNGLDLGANDYMTKPFEIEELLARIRSNLRFNKKQADRHAQAELSLGKIKIQTGSREVYDDGTIIELTPKEYDLLLYLTENKNQALEREQILNYVWGYDYFGDTNVIDVYVRYLRKKMPDAPIQTVRGVGYMVKDYT